MELALTTISISKLASTQLLIKKSNETVAYREQKRLST